MYVEGKNMLVKFTVENYKNFANPITLDFTETHDYKFNNQVFFDGKWDYLETFKLTFDDKNNLIDIKNI